MLSCLDARGIAKHHVVTQTSGEGYKVDGKDVAGAPKDLPGMLVYIINNPMPKVVTPIQVRGWRREKRQRRQSGDAGASWPCV